MSFKVIPNGSVTTPAGFLASGMNAGIKKSFRKSDVALILSESPAVCAGTFTTNQVKAWPLLHDLKVIRKPNHRVIFSNSGNANCFNGKSGKQAVLASLKLLSKKLKVSKSQIFLASTGIIGRAFPVEKIEAAIPTLISHLSREGGHQAAHGILTTDTYPKEIAIRFTIGGKQVTMAAMAKGAGMVCPDMNATGIKGKHATMLCYITTDLSISKSLLQKALSYAVDHSFNKMVIDNDQSTNDMVLALANGRAKNPKVTKEGKDFELIKKALVLICDDMTRKLVKDGEGVTHVCEVVVKGAKTPDEARRLCYQVSTSMLFKTMLAGEDPNWGRVMGSVGASQVAFSPSLDIAFDGVPILKNGAELLRNKQKLRKTLKKKEFRLEINLKKGRFEERYWTSDLTKFYVWINSRYST